MTGKLRKKEQEMAQGTSLVIQWLRLHAPMQGMGLIPGQETKIPHAAQCSQKLFFKRVLSILFFKLMYLSWRGKWQPTPVFLPGKSHGWRSLVGCSPWGHKESDTTEQLTLVLFILIGG